MRVPESQPSDEQVILAFLQEANRLARQVLFAGSLKGLPYLGTRAMDISQILNAFKTPSAAKSPGSSGTTTSVPNVAADPPQSGFSPELARAIREIASRYDLTEISPHDFSELVKKLQDAGALSTADVQELAHIRLELEQSGIDPHEPVDLVRFFQQKLAQQEKDLRKQEARQPGLTLNRTDALSGILRQIDWLQKLSSVDRRARVDPFDAVV
jgi:hypothetical protein